MLGLMATAGLYIAIGGILLLWIVVVVVADEIASYLGRR